MTNKRLAISCPQIGIRSETFIRRHIEGLSSAGAVVVANRPIPVAEETWSVDCPVYRVSDSPDWSQKLQRTLAAALGRDWEQIADRRGIVNFLKDQQADVLLGEYLDDAWPMLRIAKELGLPFFAHAHGYDLSSFFRDPQWQKRYADYKQADGLIVVNQLMKGRLLSLGIAEAKVHIIPCGVDVPQQPVKRSAKEHVRCLAVGRMVAKKAPLKLLEAFYEAVRVFPMLHLDYIGSGPLSDDVSRFVRSSGLEDKVTLHGGQSNRVVMEQMTEADIFLQHSMVDPITGDEEGMPVAIQEAMALALPVVSTRHAGIPDAVLHGKTGFLVAEGDTVGMSESIITLAQDSTLRESMGKAAWSHAKEKLSWQREKEALRCLLCL